MRILCITESDYNREGFQTYTIILECSPFQQVTLVVSIDGPTPGCHGWGSFPIMCPYEDKTSFIGQDVFRIDASERAQMFRFKTSAGCFGFKPLGCGTEIHRVAIQTDYGIMQTQSISFFQKRILQKVTLTQR
jgi:hypothetical protein